MKLGFRKKEQFFHELVQLARSAVTLPNSLEMLSRNSRSRTAACARTVYGFLKTGGTVGSAFLRTGFSSSDAAVIEAGEATGRLDMVFSELEVYYLQLAESRQRIIAQSLYPLLVLNLGVFLLAIPPAIIAGGWHTFFAKSLPILVVFYAVLIALGFGWGALRRGVAGNRVSASLITAIPILGGFLADWTAWKFSSVISLYVRAGGGVLKAFEIAGAACENALLRAAGSSLVAEVQSGNSLTETIQRQAGWPEFLGRAIEVGEHSGRLDEETYRASELYKARTLGRLNAFAMWTPKLLYIAILLFMGWQAITMITGVMREVYSAIDQ